MIRGSIVLEDSVIHFQEKDGEMEVMVGDNLTGMQRTFTCSFEQAGAIIGTSVCGTNQKVLEACEELVKSSPMGAEDWPKELKSSPIA